MISSSWPSVLWFFAFLQTWFQPYGNDNPLLYHGILIICVYVCICYFMFFDYCFILKVPSLFLFVLLHLPPLFCSLDYLNLLKMCPNNLQYQQCHSATNVVFNVVFPLFSACSASCLTLYISVYTPQQQKPDQCVPPLRRTSRLCLDSHFKLPGSSTSKVRCTHTL